MATTKTIIYQRLDVLNTIFVEILRPNSVQAELFRYEINSVVMEEDPENTNRFQIKFASTNVIDRVGVFDNLHTRVYNSDTLELEEQEITGTHEEQISEVNAIFTNVSSINKIATEGINAVFNSNLPVVIENQTEQGAMSIDNKYSYGAELIDNRYYANKRTQNDYNSAVIVYEGKLNDATEHVTTLIELRQGMGSQMVTLGIVLEDDLKDGENAKYSASDLMPKSDYQLAVTFGSAGFYTYHVKSSVGVRFVNSGASAINNSDIYGEGVRIRVKLNQDNLINFQSYVNGEWKTFISSISGLPAGNYRFVVGLKTLGSAMYNAPISQLLVDDNADNSGDDAGTSNNLDISKKMVFSTIGDNYVNVPSTINLKDSFSIFVKVVGGLNNSDRLKIVDAENGNTIGFRESMGVLYFDSFEFISGFHNFDGNFILGFVYDATINNFKMFKNNEEIHNYSPYESMLSNEVSNILNIGKSSSAGFGYDGFNGDVRSVAMFDSAIDVNNTFINDYLTGENTLNNNALWDSLTHYITAIDDKVHDLKKTGDTELSDFDVVIAEYGGE